MPSPEFLNLDDLTTTSKSVMLDGKSHSAIEMTVEAYLKRLKRAQELETQRGDIEVSMVQKVDDAIEFLRDMFPTISEERMRGLSMKQLGAMIEYAMKSPEDLAAAANKDGKETLSPNA